MSDSIEHTFATRKPVTTRTYSVRARGRDPQRLWALLASPVQWPRWSPHITAVTGADGRPPAHLRVGDRLRIHGPGPLAVTATITHVEPPTRWDFRVDPVAGPTLTASHEVRSDPLSVAVTMHVSGPSLPGPGGVVGRTVERFALRPLGGIGLLAYAPLAGLALRRLVGLADIGARA